MRGLTAIWVLVMGCYGVSGLCQETPVTEAPKYKVNDFWTYSVSQSNPGPANQRSSSWSRTILEVNSDGNMRITGNSRLYNPHMDALSAIGPEYNAVTIKFPLKIGQKWSYERKVYPEYPDLLEVGQFEVIAYESITVPAGNFQCYHIYADLRQSSIKYSVWRKIDKWYCPVVNGLGKTVETYILSKASGPGLYDVITTELTGSSYLQRLP